MMRDRISLFHYDVRRELCDDCRSERFHFVPLGAEPDPARCMCGTQRRMADVTDTSLFRLVTQPDGDIVVVPLINTR